MSLPGRPVFRRQKASDSLRAARRFLGELSINPSSKVLFVKHAVDIPEEQSGAKMQL